MGPMGQSQATASTSPKLATASGPDDSAQTATTMLIEQARKTEPGSAEEAELRSRMAQFREINEGFVAFGQIAEELGKGARGVKWLAGLLAASITASPMLGALVGDHSTHDKLDSIISAQEIADVERRELAGWLWELEQCRRDPVRHECPEEPPPSVRIMLAQQELNQ